MSVVSAPVVSVAPDYTAIKERQKAVWSSGDYGIIGATLQIVGERLCEAVDIRAASQVIDVAAGNGNATLAAARRFARVTSTDYVGALLERGRLRAQAEGFPVVFQEADAEALPFVDGRFDAALSTFGVMFAPNQEKAASELLRVVRKAGRIGLANWTPDGFIGQLLKIVSGYVPPPAGIRPPTLWGTVEGLRELFSGHEVRVREWDFIFRYESPEHWLETFRGFYGPVHRAFAALQGEKAVALEADVLGLLRQFNRGDAGTLIAPGAYLEVVIVKSAMRADR